LTIQTTLQLSNQSIKRGGGVEAAPQVGASPNQPLNQLFSLTHHHPNTTVKYLLSSLQVLDLKKKKKHIL
jgi:hypothetical protein